MTTSLIPPTVPLETVTHGRNIALDFTKPHPLLATPGKKLLPVIHVLDFEQTMRNVDVAFENGADGVF
ncbi:hypothetical protein KC887_06240, partial [Candidatus Kaiserbacteria bacterium]|nr:hypothetical protein [Candidatus Kaiserbacteria bacterium]